MLTTSDGCVIHILYNPGVSGFALRCDRLMAYWSGILKMTTSVPILSFRALQEYYLELLWYTRKDTVIDKLDVLSLVV